MKNSRMCYKKLTSLFDCQLETNALVPLQFFHTVILYVLVQRLIVDLDRIEIDNWFDKSSYAG